MRKSTHYPIFVSLEHNGLFFLLFFFFLQSSSQMVGHYVLIGTLNLSCVFYIIYNTNGRLGVCCICMCRMYIEYNSRYVPARRIDVVLFFYRISKFWLQTNKATLTIMRLICKFNTVTKIYGKFSVLYFIKIVFCHFYRS